MAKAKDVYKGNQGYQPPRQTTVENLATDDVILVLVGSPNW